MRAINNPKIIERKAIQTDMKIVGIALIGYLLLISLSELMVVFIVGVYINGAIALGASLVGFGFIWFCFRGNFRFGRVFHERREIPGRVMRNAIVCVIGIIPLYQLLEALVKWIFLRWNFFIAFPDIHIGKQWLPLAFAGTVIVRPLIDEILFRGIVLRKLSRYGLDFAIFFSAALFGLYQANLSQALEAFVLGSILGYITLRYSIKWAFVLHCVHNLMLFFVAMLGSDIHIGFINYSYNSNINYVDYGFFGLFFIMMIAVLITKRAKLLRFFRMGRSFENAWRYSIAVPWVLAYIGVTIFSSVIQTDIKSIHDMAAAAAMG